MKNRFSFMSVFLCFFLPGILIAQEIKKEQFWTKTLSPLSASSNKKGDRFSLQVFEPAAYKNAIVEGEVVKAKAAGKVKGKSELLFAFDKLMMPNGTVLPITADLTSVKNSRGVQGVDEEGRVIGKSSTGKDVARTAALAGIGALIGGAVAGGSGVAAGAAIGAAVGLTITFSTKGEDIRFAQGSLFQLALSTTKSGKANTVQGKQANAPQTIEKKEPEKPPAKEVQAPVKTEKKNIEPVP